MNRVMKWLGVGFGALLIGLSLVVVGGYLVLRNTVQPPAGAMEIAGLSASVETVRDEHGIPHIRAQTKADALAALGFAHAQDRFWQMEVLRMSGQGRLSEMFGEATLDIDRFLRTLGFIEQAQSSYQALSEANKHLLGAYTNGVNAFLTRETAAIEPSLPPEFMILGHKPEAWKPAHSLLILKIMSLQLSQNLSREMSRLRLAAQGMSPSEIDDIIPMHRDDTPPPLPDLRKWFDLNEPKEEETAALGAVFDSLQEGGNWASNNWVFAGSRTASGKPLLANDPHLGFTAPSLWYLAHLSWKDGDRTRNVIGATIPAFPSVLLGRNDNVAWGFTNAGADVQDVFIEQVDPNDPTRYRTPDGWAEFESRDETIVVSGGEDEILKVRSTRHGPILPGSYKQLEEILPDNHVAALAWTGLSDKDPSFAMVMALADVDTVEEFRQAVSLSVAPMQSIVVADTDGNIAQMTPAMVPVRKADNSMMGRAPVPGWMATFDWTGLADGTTTIDIENPSSGALGSANSRLPVETQNNFYTFDWDEPFRTDRVANSVLKANAKQTVDDMIAGQMDSYSPVMAQLRDRLVSVLGDEASKDLRNWDGRMEADQHEPLFMTAFHRNLLKAVFEDELGATFDAAHHATGASLLRVLDGKASRNWCNYAITDAEETCEEILRGVYTGTRQQIDGQRKWGDEHIVFNEHRPFSSVWPLSKLFTIERPFSGGNFALLRGKSDFKDEEHPFRAVHGAGYRAVYDFADLDKSIFIQTTGQSGNPFSKHYDDMAGLWAIGKYLPMTTKPEEYEKNALGTWLLQPAQ